MNLSSIIDKINLTVPKCLDALVYGLAQSVVRKRESKEGYTIELLPGIVADNGDITYVGFDDQEPVIIYHKCNSISCQNKPGNGDSYDVFNIYNNCMIVYNDRAKTHMRADVLLQIIQSNFPSAITLAPYKTIAAKFINVILNDQVVFASEYQNTEFDLPANKNLFQINYTIESLFSKRCFDTCPE